MQEQHFESAKLYLVFIFTRNILKCLGEGDKEWDGLMVLVHPRME